MERIIYVGSFNPAHFGHKYVLEQAENYFQCKVEVCICQNELKKDEFLSLEERYDFAKYIFGSDVNVSYYKTYDEIRKLMEEAKYIVRGSRNIYDYIYCLKGGIHYDILKYYKKIKIINAISSIQYISSTRIRNELYSENPNYDLLDNMIGMDGRKMLLKKVKSK